MDKYFIGCEYNWYQSDEQIAHCWIGNIRSHDFEAIELLFALELLYTELSDVDYIIEVVDQGNVERVPQN